MNRLHSYFADQQALKVQRRRQGDIVRDYRDDIIGLIADDGATLPEVAAAVRAQGEPVLDPGFKAAILKSIGTVKDIRAGKVIAVAGKSAASAPALASTTSSLPATAPSNSTGSMPPDDDDDDAFAARRPRR